MYERGIVVNLLKKTILGPKVSEALSSVLPVTGIVFLLMITIMPVDAEMLLAFLIGAVFLIIGMGLFTLGAETAMSPMGEYVGLKMTKSRSLLIIIFVSLFVGAMITVSEPDLVVLAAQVFASNPSVLIWSVALGVGVLLVVAMLRIIFSIRLRYLLFILYGIVFILAIFVPRSFLPLSFDSGGVTTGPMTVPFIMALGVGAASIRADDKGGDSFGLVALCSIGPIIAVMILGIITGGNISPQDDYSMEVVRDSRDLMAIFLRDLPHHAKDVAVAVGPIVAFFLIFRALSGGRGTKGLGKIFVGVAYTYVGLVLFLTGVNVGFMPVGAFIGEGFVNSSFKWLIVPVGMIMGYFIVAAEPAVHVLKKQVEDVTAGMISGRLLSLTLSIGVAVAVGISLVRVLTGISIMWIIIPGYVISLALSFFVPDIFTSIAFDSGGVASGPMTATFLLPFAVGASANVSGGNIVTDAYGLVAFVAMTPLIAIQILGVVYKVKQSKLMAADKETTVGTETVITDDDIIDM